MDMMVVGAGSNVKGGGGGGIFFKHSMVNN